MLYNIFHIDKYYIFLEGEYMSTVVIVKNTMLRFVEITERTVDYSIIEHESKQHTKSTHLGKGIFAITSNHGKNQPVYLLKLESCTKRIVGNFMLANGAGDQYSPLTEEQEDFIIQNCEVTQEPKFCNAV